MSATSCPAGDVVEKWVWTDADLERMSFHDVKVYAFATRIIEPATLNYNLLFDVDYILAWLCEGSGSTFRFAVSPATLVFEHASELAFEGKPLCPDALLDINSLTRTENPSIPGASVATYRWTIAGHDGKVTFGAAGFKLYIRRAPVVSGQQSLEYVARGGISFEECVPGPRGVTSP
jgi:hypothetical protein